MRSSWLIWLRKASFWIESCVSLALASRRARAVRSCSRLFFLEAGGIFHDPRGLVGDGDQVLDRDRGALGDLADHRMGGRGPNGTRQLAFEVVHRNRESHRAGSRIFPCFFASSWNSVCASTGPRMRCAMISRSSAPPAWRDQVRGALGMLVDIHDLRALQALQRGREGHHRAHEEGRGVDQHGPKHGVDHRNRFPRSRRAHGAGASRSRRAPRQRSAR